MYFTVREALEIRSESVRSVKSEDSNSIIP